MRRQPETPQEAIINDIFIRRLLVIVMSIAFLGGLAWYFYSISVGIFDAGTFISFLGLFVNAIISYITLKSSNINNRKLEQLPELMTNGVSDVIVAKTTNLQRSVNAKLSEDVAQQVEVKIKEGAEVAVQLIAETVETTAQRIAELTVQQTAEQIEAEHGAGDYTSEGDKQ